jgi:hypothetical protein
VGSRGLRSPRAHEPLMLIAVIALAGCTEASTVAARSLSAICLLRSFSTVFAHAAALAATACCLRAMLTFSTAEPQSGVLTVIAVRGLRSACLLLSFSTAFTHPLPAAGRPIWRSMALGCVTTGK